MKLKLKIPVKKEFKNSITSHNGVGWNGCLKLTKEEFKEIKKFDGLYIQENFKEQGLYSFETSNKETATKIKIMYC